MGLVLRPESCQGISMLYLVSLLFFEINTKGLDSLLTLFLVQQTNYTRFFYSLLTLYCNICQYCAIMPINNLCTSDFSSNNRNSHNVCAD